MDVYAAAPPKSELMGSRANISVVTAPLPEDGSVDTFYEASRKDLERVLLDFKVIETGQAAFFGFGGKKIEYYHSAHTRDKIRTIQYYLVHRNHALVITYSADLDEYPKYLDIFEKSAKTLKFH